MAPPGALDLATSRTLMQRLNRDAALLARHFGLRYKAIESERANVTSRYGVCYSDGVIKIRLRHAVSGRPLKYSSLVNTLCHELAHLRHFNHGERFRLFYRRILEFARARGIYRPAPRSLPDPAARRPAARPERSVRGALAAREPERTDDSGTPAPVQLSLFG